ncbi:MAG: DUF2007 domain-containing protein [Herpetosiphonaceae bacterium]|nr:DUF2007 domain-containing protein [Herpetosiphonaceae bacterium]
MMDHILRLPMRSKASLVDRSWQTATASASFKGEREQPVIVAVIQGPVAAEMALEALHDAGIPAMLRRNPVGAVYGMSLGAWGETPLLVPAPLYEQAREILLGMGLVEEG